MAEHAAGTAVDASARRGAAPPPRWTSPDSGSGTSVRAAPLAGVAGLGDDAEIVLGVAVLTAMFTIWHSTHTYRTGDEAFVGFSRTRSTPVTSSMTGCST
ncbi:hypothetical protein [Nonomuraea aurantiaca]|uniref:hypothetical protein n=1 Tax=Nonomuraea aurantiaca TaxID=2878562 RepID=UPI001CD9D430|nr:hypothetical protein [Nonomuraea aurantiaca]MCA2229595.1 hypothetical protein [Nonomuraea aurantiaca]